MLCLLIIWISVPVLDLKSPTLHSYTRELRIKISNVDLEIEVNSKVNLLQEIGSSILLISLIIIMFPIIIPMSILYCLTKKNYTD